MARIQILELPMEHGPDDEVITPFAIIIDQHEPDIEVNLAAAADAFRVRCGARAVLVTEATLDLVGPTLEEIAAGSQRSHVGTAVVDVVPDLSGFEKDIREVVESIGPQKVEVRVEGQRTNDLIRSEIRDSNSRIADAPSDGRA